MGAVHQRGSGGENAGSPPLGEGRRLVQQIKTVTKCCRDSPPLGSRHAVSWQPLDGRRLSTSRRLSTIGERVGLTLGVVS